MSDSALAAAIRPKVYASSTTGVKKSAVTTTARAGPTRTTAPSSPCSTPTIRSVPGPSGTSLAIVSSSSPGGILQAQPPPRAYWVSRTESGPVMRSKIAPGPDTPSVTRAGVAGGPDGGRPPAAGNVSPGGVRVPGAPGSSNPGGRRAASSADSIPVCLLVDPAREWPATAAQAGQRSGKGRLQRLDLGPPPHQD